MAYRKLIFGIVLSICWCGTLFAQELAVPRFVSLRFSDSNLRTGPGNRYPIKFVYKTQNYPVEVIDEYELWRQIREIDGTVGWVHRRTLSGVRYALVTEDASLYKKAQESSPVLAYVQKNAIGKIESCPAKSDFCQLTFLFGEKKYKGWMNKNSFYGVYPREVIH